MEIVSIMLILSGMLYLAYGILFRHKKSLYFLSVVINEDKKREYLDLQLHVSILNGVFIILAGLLGLTNDLPSFYFTAVPVIVHLNNFIAKMIGFRKGYLEDI